MDRLRDIVEMGRSHGSRPALIDGTVRLTYADLVSRAERLAATLRQRGVAPGDRVALNARNSFRYIEINFACALAGAVLTPLNFRLAPGELATILDLTAPKLLFNSASDDTFGLPAIAWRDEDDTATDNAYEALIRAAPTERLPEGGEACADPAQIFFTSGTSGQPKGAVLTHGNLTASALDAVETLELSADDVWLHASPMFHLVDAFAIWGLSIVGGRHLISHFDPDSFAALVERERVTKTSLPPTLLDWIAQSPQTAEHDLSSLDRISYGGSPMQEAVYGRCVSALGCRLIQAYGLTEGSGFVCHEVLADNPDPRRVINTVGKAVRHVQVALHDDQGAAVPGGAIGEFVLKGPRVFTGYWADPQATAQAFDGPWYQTGDLGVQDAEGRFRVIGRKKEMIISGGENIYPAEVLNALLAHPGVAEAAVFGLPSEQWGEQVCAVAHPTSDWRDTLTPDHLIAHCRSLIAAYKAPKRVLLSAEPLPKNGPGKIATSAIRSQLLREEKS